jgi:general secretion pathway protein B
MSLILDALRKSERNRQHSLNGQLGSAETPSGPGRLPVPWVTLIALLLVANGVLLFFLWPRTPVTLPAAPVAAAAPAAAVYHPAVRSLADEVGDDDAAPAPTPVQTEAAVPTAPEQVAEAPSTVADAPQPATHDSSLPTFDALSPDQRQGLPALHLDVHGYATKAADRFVVINLKQYHIGDTLAEGLVLKDIVPQGAVLEFHGVTFLLPAS